MTDKGIIADRAEKPPKIETKSDAWANAAADAYLPKTMQGAKTAQAALAGSGEFSLASAGFPKAAVNNADFAIAPCTPPGKDPKDDPSNPASHNYDATKYGPSPAKPIEEKSDGLITPQELMDRKASGGAGLMKPEVLPYTGMCPPDPPEKDYSKVPMF